MIHIAYLIPIFPLLAFPILLLTGYRYREKAHWVTIGSLILSTIVSLGVMRDVSAGTARTFSIPWFPAGFGGFTLGIHVDPLAALMCVVVSVIALLIQLYSIGYMHGDPRYHRFYAYMAMFSAAMLSLVLADNWLLLYASWELVGLGSYLLIGFWFEKPEAAKAAKKAFITTRIGDVGLALGILLLFAITGSVEMSKIFHLAETGGIAAGIAGSAGLLIFAGAMGKSAQFPLHIWLPDAMEGPSPVSALIHAATMVAAGVYLVARSAPLYAAASGTPVALIIAIIATITLLMSGAIGMVVTDIKRVLAYSTISQLGYMMLGLAAGGTAASMFHLTTHAFFKALLFLCAGSVIHAAHTQNLFEMGGLGKKMQITAWTMGIGAISLIGIPPFAGFWSKDEILVEVFHAFPILAILAMVGVGMTAFYMARLFFLAFMVPPKKESHAHESPQVMTVPLILLAVFSVIAGLLGSPWLGMRVQAFLHGGSLHHGAAHATGVADIWLPVISIALGMTGIAVAWAVYVSRWIELKQYSKQWNGLYQLVLNKFYIDEFVHNLVIVPGRVGVQFLAMFDNMIVDGLVNFTASLTYAFSVLNRAFDTIVVDGAVNLIAWTTAEASRVFRRVQTGFAQHYLLVLFAGVFILAAMQLMR